MPEVRVEYPFQISYKDERILGSLICLRGETAEELGQEFVQVTAIFDAIFAAEAPAEVVPVVPPAEEGEAAPTPPANVTPIAKPAANRPIPKLPPEAFAALEAQGKHLCTCAERKWWDNRQTKTKPTQPDFKCCTCNQGIWLTPLKGEGE